MVILNIFPTFIAFFHFERYCKDINLVYNNKGNYKNFSNLFMSSLHDRLKKVVKHLIAKGLGSNQQDIGNLLGYSNKSSFSQVLNNKVPIPGDFIDRICDLDKNINKVWVESGKQTMITERNEVDSFSEVIITLTDKNTELSIEVGRQINENEHLHKKNMTLLSELEILKKENEKLKTELKDIKSRTKQLTNVAAAQYVEKKVTHSFVAEPEQEKLKK